MASNGRRSRNQLLPTLTLLALAWLGSAPSAFCGAKPAARLASTSTARHAFENGIEPIEATYPFELLRGALLEPVTAYVNIWVPLFKSAQESGLAPEFLLHWGHGAAMATVLLAMGGYGTFLGWQTRLGNGGVVYPLSVGKTAADLHPTLMGLALFLFLLGGQGGLVLLAAAGQPILQSAHSSTAIIGLLLMSMQALLGVTMGNESLKRSVHAFLGTGVMLVLMVHMSFGIGLGSSF